MTALPGAEMSAYPPDSTIEQRLAQCERELAEARRAGREAVEQSVRRSRFLAAACHDLRQPVHALRLFTSVLGEQALPAEAAGVVRQMDVSLGVLEDLFDDLLDAAQITERGVEPRRVPITLQTLFDRVAVHVQPMAFDKGLDLRFRGGHRVVMADPVLLERMLRNLVVNAVRYTEDGGVLVGCRPRGQGASLEVWDSGIGMTPDVLAQAFEPYVQADGDGWRHRVLGEQGWGLGLAIVRMLAKVQGLTLDVRSQPGRGTRFTVSLPGAADVSPTVRGTGAPVPTAVPLTLEGRRIAVALGVADEATVCGWLTQWGVDVLAGAQGAPLAEASPPDLLLADAVETAQALRAAWSCPVPVALIGAAAQSADELPACRGLPGVPVPNRLRALVAFLLAGSAA